MMSPPQSYYKERDFTPCPKPSKQADKSKVPPPRIRMTHKGLAKAVPRRKDGCKLGLRKRIALMAWYKARLI